MPNETNRARRRALLIELIDRARLAHDAAEDAGEYKTANRLLAVIRRLARALDGTGRTGPGPAGG